jgi:release factor glutamine methyltransferase
VTTLNQALQQALAALQRSDTGRLEAEVLLAHVLRRPRSHLHAWPDAELDDSQSALFRQLVARRAAGEPVAYLTGRREFWSLEFEVSDATLIPRPETELLVEQALAVLSAGQPLRVADLGTGSGAVAVALAHERRRWRVCASDRSGSALEIARRNAARLGVPEIDFVLGNWSSALADCCLDAIVSNPPYVAENDPHLARGDVRFEPRSALVAGPQGLDDLLQLIHDATRVLKPGGWLFLEHGPAQSAAIQALLNKLNFNDIATTRDLAGLERVTRAHKPG